MVRPVCHRPRSQGGIVNNCSSVCASGQDQYSTTCGYAFSTGPTRSSSAFGGGANENASSNDAVIKTGIGRRCSGLSSFSIFGRDPSIRPLSSSSKGQSCIQGSQRTPI